VVTARSFAGPAATAEIAAGLVRVGGVLVVSDPPEPDPQRWPAEKLAELGFGAAERQVASGAQFVVLQKEHGAPDDVPRGVGRPTKRPRW
jgi:16S rRNA (guanine527-N7)-methyltransferase